MQLVQVRSQQACGAHVPPFRRSSNVCVVPRVNQPHALQHCWGNQQAPNTGRCGGAGVLASAQLPRRSVIALCISTAARRAAVSAWSQHKALIIPHHRPSTCQGGYGPVVAMLIGALEGSSRTTPARVHAYSSTQGTLCTWRCTCWAPRLQVPSPRIPRPPAVAEYMRGCAVPCEGCCWGMKTPQGPATTHRSSIHTVHP
jgi:hypothetical protein